MKFVFIFELFFVDDELNGSGFYQVSDEFVLTTQKKLFFLSLCLLPV